jgi:chaperonin GroEL
MSKELVFNTEAREKILSGAKVVFDAVSTTLGPRSNNVAIERPWGTPSVIHDGVGVAKEIDLKDKFENVGAQLIKGAAERTNNEAGDGTSVTTILTYNIAKEAHRNIVAGASPMVIRQDIESAVKDMTESIEKMAVKLKTDEEIKQVAVISAQNEEIGELITQAIKKLGRDSIITVEESQTTEMSIDFKEGMQFDKGWLNSYFITDQEKNEAVVSDPYILVTDTKITQMPDFVPFLKGFAENPQKSSNSLVIIADEVSGPPLATLIANKLQGNLNVLVVNAPNYGGDRRSVLEDIAFAINGRFISKEAGHLLKDVTLEDLGRADKVISSQDSTVIVGGKGKDSIISARAQQIKGMIEKSENEFETEKLRERLAKLTSGIAVINVGANSEAEMRELKERVIDAISATKAAIEEGIVIGGEMALLHATNAIQGDSVGSQVVKNAVTQPFNVLMRNSGYDPGYMMAKLEGSTSVGVDVTDGTIKDLVKAGIIDPAKVVKSALKNATSTAIMMLTTNCIITEIKDEPAGRTD